MYIVKVILHDDSVQTFEYNATDAYSAIFQFQEDTRTEVVTARENAKEIDAFPA
jgi:hypothetical protein